MKRVFAGGEALSRELRDRFARVLPSVHLSNHYGPTETTVDVTYWDCTLDHGPSVPIGHPIANVEAHVLDSRLQAVPVGVPGELYIGGENVSRGYHRRPDLQRNVICLIPSPATPARACTGPAIS